MGGIWAGIAGLGAAALSVATAAWPLPISLHSDLAHPAPITRAATSQLTSLAPLPLPDGTSPDLQARSALIADATTGLVIWSRDPDGQLPVASLTKLMTAVVTLEHRDPAEVVRVESADLATGTAESVMGLRAGERLTVHELLAGLLIPSGGDAARALARSTSGEFVSLMNTEAVLIGLTRTHFVNPTGEDALGGHSSVRDLAVLARYALRYPLIRELTGTASYTAHSLDGRAYPLVSTNQLVVQGSAQGVKTGTTDQAGQCLITLAHPGGHEILSVVLASPNRFDETRGLLRWTEDHLQWH